MEGATDLIHVIYTSHLTPGVDESVVFDILSTARRTNPSLGVTGMLLVRDRSFYQVLEGPPDAVRTLFDKIGRDPRHQRVLKLFDERIVRRSFGRWSMGLAEVSDAELQSVPGLNDFFGHGHSLTELGPGTGQAAAHRLQGAEVGRRADRGRHRRRSARLAPDPVGRRSGVKALDRDRIRFQRRRAHDSRSSMGRQECRTRPAGRSMV